MSETNWKALFSVDEKGRFKSRHLLSAVIANKLADAGDLVRLTARPVSFALIPTRWILLAVSALVMMGIAILVPALLSWGAYILVLGKGAPGGSTGDIVLTLLTLPPIIALFFVSLLFWVESLERVAIAAFEVIRRLPSMDFFELNDELDQDDKTKGSRRLRLH